VTRARGARVGRGLGWPSMVIGAALALAAMLGGTASPAAGAAPASASRSCGKATGPFTVHGTRVLGAHGKVFVSYGTTVSGLQNLDWQSSVNDDLQQITATADDWCANTVRLQLSQDNLVGPTGTVSDGYLSAIHAEVSAAESNHLVVVLNDSTEQTTSAWNAELGPTSGTETFWQILAQAYGGNPQVIFDLFNEPRLYASGMSAAHEWKLWLDGGSFAGTDYPFGMARLAGYVRNTLHAKNLFWIEGPRYSVSFAGVRRAPPQRPARQERVVRRLRLPDRHPRRSGGGRRVDELRAGADHQSDDGAHLVLDGCADDGAQVPGLPVLPERRPERVRPPARLHGPVRQQPG
jgi:Cellulase (glycosyl hydrolase family 5)